MSDTDLPIATLAYQRQATTTGWWTAARIVGQLAFWYGIVRLVQVIQQLVTALFFGGSFGNAMFGSTSLLATIVALLITSTNLIGSALAIAGGRRLHKAQASGIQTALWGAILLATASVALSVQHLVQIVGQGQLPRGYMPFLVTQVVIGGVTVAILPGFLAYFFWRPELRQEVE